MLRALPSLALPDSADSDVFILIVDDDRANFLLLKQILKRGEIDNCIHASSADEAFELLEAKTPSLIMLDIMLPKINGFDFCQRIKQVPAYQNIPIIFISGLQGAEVRAQAFTLGSVDYLQKPYDHNEVVARVKVHLQNGLMLKALEHYSVNAEKEMALAVRSQRSLLPSEEHIKTLSAQYSFTLANAFIPYSGLAGDFWQILPIDEDQFALTTADFSGHGIAAALETVRFHSYLFELKAFWPTPEELFAELNKRLFEMLAPEAFATFSYSLINTKENTIQSYSAGAPALLHLRKNENTFELFTQASSPLGIMPEWSKNMEFTTFKIEKGDAIVLYSDALSEIPDKDEKSPDPLSHKSLEHLLKLNPLSAQTITDYLLDLFHKAPKHAREDDLTIVSLVL